MLRRPWLGLLTAFAAMIALFGGGRPDFVASDPLWYASIARQLETDPKSLFALHDLHPFVMRLGLTTPLSVLYRLFGVSDVTTNLPALLAALTILVVVYTTASTPRAKLVALGIGVFSTALIQNALILNVDLPCAALMAVSIACLSRRDGSRGAWWLSSEPWPPASQPSWSRKSPFGAYPCGSMPPSSIYERARGVRGSPCTPPRS